MPLPARAAALAGGGAVLVFLALQFVRPALPNPPVTADLEAPAAAKAILRNSCYACHSNETRVPWFDQVVPAYWLVAHDVKEGRARLNFSGIGALPEAKRKALLWESVNMAMLGAMPPGRYTLIHPGAKVTPEQLAALKEWLHPAAPAPTPAPAVAPSGGAEAFAAPVPEALPSAPPAPNGMAFPSDFREWRPISTTDRFDNRTLRMILGNAVAQRAVAEGRVRSWPDGAALAKIAYAPSPDGRAAAFKQVEFMVKDAKGRADTEGWAYGRWLGNDLKPYGKDRDFARECAGCHAPMQGNDYVYSLPLKDGPADAGRFNAEAALPAGLGPDLPADLLSWQPLSSSVDEAAGTMATLYANGPALAAGRAGNVYPVGAVLARVAWARRDDPHWFGARIPGAVQEVETVTVREDLSQPTASLRPAFAYVRYAGSPLARQPEPDAATVQERALALLAEKASPLP